MSRISSPYGKMYYKYNDSVDKFDVVRAIDSEENGDGSLNLYCTHEYVTGHIYSDDTRIVCINSKSGLDNDDNHWSPLKEDGILFISDIVASTVNNKEIHDLMCIFFANDPETGYPNSDKPTVVARQALTNIFDSMLNPTSNTVGFSTDAESCSSLGYSIAELIQCEKIKDGVFINIYKTDTELQLSKFVGLKKKDGTEYRFNHRLNNIVSVLQDLWDARLRYCKNTIVNFDDSAYKNHDPIDGYCYGFGEFNHITGLSDDIRRNIGIISVDFGIKDKSSLNNVEKQIISLLYGGIHIDRTYASKFSYEFDLESIKMKYMLVMDANENLFIVAYTEDKNEVTVAELEDVKKNEDTLRERLKTIIKSFDGVDIDIVDKQDDENKEDESLKLDF